MFPFYIKWQVSALTQHKFVICLPCIRRWAGWDECYDESDTVQRVLKTKPLMSETSRSYSFTRVNQCVEVNDLLKESCP